MSTIHTYAVTPFIQGLKALTAILKKGEEHAKANNIPPEDLVNASLIADMKPLSFQVFITTNTAVKLVSRATFVEPPAQSDTDKTFDDFYKRIDEALAVLEKADPQAIAANEGKTFKAPLGPTESEFTPESYTNGYAVPNFFFHLVTAYDILRAKGVPVGKMDYLKDFLGDIAA
ncbi:DUF1993 domain-containing protein [Aspergillus foveolatus]|uniref:DUF1993 domain-containing protein n=1 Tax=Aspergillus foveolatus TaxID=210207 RepID=UPI003CCCDCE1